MTAPLPLVRREQEDDHSLILSTAEARDVADFINSCITGETPPGVRLEQLSAYDIAAAFDSPKHEAGIRWFYLALEPTSGKVPVKVFILAASDDPESDCVSIPLARLLAAVGCVEQQGGDIQGLAQDMARGEVRRTLLGAVPGRETAKMLADNERAMNAACDDIRAAVAPPHAWALIGPDVRLFGTLAFQAVAVEAAK